MKNALQLISIVAVLLSIATIITFSPIPQAKALAKWPNPYWQMLARYQEKSD